LSTVFAKKAWVKGGWASDVRMVIDSDGRVESLVEGAAEERGDIRLKVALPTMPNLHSHAFQRAMAGMAEYRAHQSDSFWSWREVMYTFARTLDLAAFKTIARQLYGEMLAAGYGAVAEFHYLHRLGGDRLQGHALETSLALMEAACEAGIDLCLCPVLYQQGGFANAPLGKKQRRFHLEVEAYCQLLETLLAKSQGQPNMNLAMTFHSLRAVGPEAMREMVAFWNEKSPDRPIHIHIAEQQAEVEACVAWSGRRPVRWLLDEIGIDERWCLVHATHLSDDEVRDLAKSGATVGLCPTTEANLGDGFFELLDYQREGGVWGIGSDSHISVSPVEELRLLEYGQRLRFQRRNLVATADAPHVGAELWRRALEGGSRAIGRKCWGLQVGQRADLLTLDVDHPILVGHEETSLMDAWLFSGNQPLVDRVMVGGRWLVEGGDHCQKENFADAYRLASKGWLTHHRDGST